MKLDKDQKDMIKFYFNLQIFALLFYTPMYFIFKQGEQNNKIVHANVFFFSIYTIQLILTCIIPIIKQIKNK